MPRLYREAPVNSIWEGSGNVICLDVLRAIDRDEATVTAFLAEVDTTRGVNAALDAAVEALKSALANRKGLELQARAIVEQMAVVLQASLLVRYAPSSVAEAFCATRLGSRWSGAYGVCQGVLIWMALLRVRCRGIE